PALQTLRDTPLILAAPAAFQSTNRALRCQLPDHPSFPPATVAARQRDSSLACPERRRSVSGDLCSATRDSCRVIQALHRPAPTIHPERCHSEGTQRPRNLSSIAAQTARQRRKARPAPQARSQESARPSAQIAL